MSNPEEQKRGSWTGAAGFILAAVGSAVGLGNIWKFPYIAGNNGGGAFVLIYILCLAIIGLPLLIAEMTIGRLSGKAAFGTYSSLAPTERGGRAWAGFGALIIVSSFFLLSFYSVVGGWTIAYFVKALTGTFDAQAAKTSQAIFENFVADPIQGVFYHLIFMAICMAVVARGVSKGIEHASKIMMPILSLLLLVLLAYSLTTPGAGQALRFMFYPDFSKLHPAAILEAMGHSFFTLSLGMGVMIVYGSYLDKKNSIFKAGATVALADTAIALIAGVTIFGIVFSAGQAPEQGPGLIFITLPALFAQLHFGSLWAVMFFLLLAFAALTSGISIIEVTVSYAVDQHRISRKKATLYIGSFIFLLGLLSVFSFNILADITLLTLHSSGSPKKLNIFDTFDYLISNWSLTIGGLGIALFTGWAVPRAQIWNELKDDALGKIGFSIWLSITRFIAPIAVIFVLLHSIGVFD